ncbi:MAG: hypothetical protein IJJ99_04150 [Oscillospiraceae bacterium]|nr:hypothetical protein [Oscillospiraceae bacterium]
MEQITPQYKRGKYIRRRTRKKRIVIICLCAAIVLAAAALLFFFHDQLFPGKEPAPTEASDTVQHCDPSPAKPSGTESGAQSTTEPVEPISGTQVSLADGRLLLTYDSKVLTLTETEDLTTLTQKDPGAEIPRMDIQQLPSKLGMLRDSEKERIAIALMQAYYYHPQHTADVDLTVTMNEKNEFAATMQIPAIDDAPAAVCSVRLLTVGDGLWAAVLLQPEGMESTALADAFRWLTPTEENG